MIIYAYEVFVGDDVFTYDLFEPPEIIAAFIESDRRKVVDMQAVEDGLEPSEEYVVSVSNLQSRLNVMGYTTSRWRLSLQGFVETQNELLAKQFKSNEIDSDVFASRRALLAETSMERWTEAFNDLVAEDWHGPVGDLSLKPFFYNEESCVLQSPFQDEFERLRSTLDLHDAEADVRFTFEWAVSSLNVNPATAFTKAAKRSLTVPARALAQILILTEGPSDSELLKTSFGVLYPEVAHMYSFLDSSLKPFGGVSQLERLALGMAASGVSNRVVVLLDNDAAGVAAWTRLENQRLPSNVRVLRLPDLDYARNYPCLGPTGPGLADVNGRACSIELYCGGKALRGDDISPSPVFWTGYDKALKRYQGEPEEKEAIRERYFSVLDRSKFPQTDPEFAAMRSVLKAITTIDWQEFESA